ncbi:hypothetical protein E2562_012479 [Oryza meyeriana var. granulata]|uniref:Uncharacterized protein n=1 Tax=Oryza meyeriana var. granulata TaxID=110450 RepID=A0A6G1BVI0_9ORYZ|nr:hypothetical protein E2562_012479 [Oryza meyeriana var. granulata]
MSRDLAMEAEAEGFHVGEASASTRAPAMAKAQAETFTSAAASAPRATAMAEGEAEASTLEAASASRAPAMAKAQVEASTLAAASASRATAMAEGKAEASASRAPTMAKEQESTSAAELASRAPAMAEASTSGASDQAEASTSAAQPRWVILFTVPDVVADESVPEDADFKLELNEAPSACYIAVPRRICPDPRLYTIRYPSIVAVDDSGSGLFLLYATGILSVAYFLCDRDHPQGVPPPRRT